MTKLNWGAVFATAQKMIDDFKRSKPLPAPSSPSMTSAQIVASARQLQAALPVIIAWLEVHPGAERAADDFLEALRAGGVTWAAGAENAVNAAPGALATAESWLPELIGLLGAFQPAPTWAPGPGPFRGR